MKLRSTTPISEFFSLGVVAFFILISTTILTGLFSQASSAETNTERQAKIDELTKKIDEQVASTRALNQQGSDIKSQIDALKRERDYLQLKIDKTKNRQAELVNEIADTEIRIAQQKEVLGQLMADAYISETISPIEMLASSNSIGDYIDRQTFNKIMQDTLSSSINEVNRLQKSLANQQNEMKRISGEQHNQALALDGKKAEQTKMLIATNSSSSRLTEITTEMANERRSLQQQQQQSMASVMGGAAMVTPGTISRPVQPSPISPPAPTTPATPSTPVSPTPPPHQPTAPPPVVLPNGGYPGYLQDCFVDSNALSYGFDPWGYGCRQCVSYTAWKVLQKTGRAPIYWGNAKDWPASARRVGYGTGSTPRAGSVGVMTGGPYGHVVWVEGVNANGTINISQYNYWLPGKSNGGWGWYSEFQNVSPAAYQVYIYV